jgi:hypothetical protein
MSSFIHFKASAYYEWNPKKRIKFHPNLFYMPTSAELESEED